MSQTLDSILHTLNHERDMATDMAADVDVDVAADMDVDMADDMHADNPCFHGPVSSGPNIFGIPIISIQSIFRIQSIFSFQLIY
jgi:hypothetical protein